VATAAFSNDSLTTPIHDAVARRTSAVQQQQQQQQQQHLSTASKELFFSPPSLSSPFTKRPEVQLSLLQWDFF
jgi:transcription initiation factor TFIID subunit TAF12